MNNSTVTSGKTFSRLKIERMKLPIFHGKRKIIQELQHLDTAIIIGETGSGKTTQLPQYLLEFELNRNATIAITQPRRVAAITVAQRVAQEHGSALGAVVGYCVRFEDSTTDTTKLKYMTDGMLLREAILDPLLRRYSIVILDEAHERTIHTDVLFGVVKQAQRKRREAKHRSLKIIIMSATMNVDAFSEYFDNAPVLYIEGRQFPIQVYYTVKPQSDHAFAAIVTLFKIHQQQPPNHDVLIFMTGQEEIESATQTVKDAAKSLQGEAPPLIVCPLYAALPAQQQLKVFNTTPPGSRKVIIATNIAETSITIPNIKFVIDTGVVKAKVYNPNSGLDLLRVVKISKAQALQRTGRAGRESSGSCYRLYTEEQFDEFNDNTVPEIQRCNLLSVVLQMMAMGITDIINFDFMDKPSHATIISAFHHLHLLGAVTKNDNLELTKLGRQLSAFPLDPRLSRCLIAANEFGCLEEMLTVISLLSVDSVIFTPLNRREEALGVRQKFLSSDGDHLTLLNIYKAYKGAQGSKHFCYENFINQRNMKMACEVRKQVHDICVAQKMKLSSCGEDTNKVRYCLSFGFFMNAAELQADGDKYVCLSTRKVVSIHPSSSLFRFKPSCVIYNELVKTAKCYMRDVSVVDPDWLSEVAPSYFRKTKTS